MYEGAKWIPYICIEIIQMTQLSIVTWPLKTVWFFLMHAVFVNSNFTHSFCVLCLLFSLWWILHFKALQLKTYPAPCSTAEDVKHWQEQHTLQKLHQVKREWPDGWNSFIRELRGRFPKISDQTLWYLLWISLETFIAHTLKISQTYSHVLILLLKPALENRTHCVYDCGEAPVNFI